MQESLIIKFDAEAFEKRKVLIEEIILHMKNNRERLLTILTEISQYQAAIDEIHTSIEVLEKSFREVSIHQPPYIAKSSVFMPSNVLLYSYVLYLLIPSLYIKTIEFRSSSQVFETMKKIHSFFKEVYSLPIQLMELSYNDFMNQSVKTSQVVVFTGSYKNAEKVKYLLHEDQMFIFLGHGINPFVITESADIEKAVNDLISIRLYNSGQDCMGPDLIYIPETKINTFLELLTEKVKELTVGERTNPEADYGPIYYTSTLENVAAYLNKFGESIVTGGTIDYSKKVIHPTILIRSTLEKNTIIEFFAPVFNCVVYQDIQEVRMELESGYFKERALGASIYGDIEGSLLESLQKKYTVSLNETLLDIENGNEPFGGYGAMANYIAYKKNLYIEPILISKAINEYWNAGGFYDYSK